MSLPTFKKEPNSFLLCAKALPMNSSEHSNDAKNKNISVLSDTQIP